MAKQCESCGSENVAGTFPADGFPLDLCRECSLIDPNAVPDIHDPSWKGYIDHETDISKFFVAAPAEFEGHVK